MEWWAKQHVRELAPPNDPRQGSIVLMYLLPDLVTFNVMLLSWLSQYGLTLDLVCGSCGLQHEQVCFYKSVSTHCWAGYKKLDR